MARRKSAPRKSGLFRWISGLALAIVGVGPLSGYEWVFHAYEWLRENRPAITSQQQVDTTQGDSTGLVRAYFTTPELTPEKSVIVAACVGYIDQAKQTLDVAAFELDNRLITEAIVRASKRGVRVRVVTETNYLHESGIQAMLANGIPVVDDQRSGALMHDKFIIFDQKAVWTGSMNLTENCAYKNNNNGIFIDNPEIARNYSTKFAWMFEQRKFGGAPKWQKIPYPSVKLPDGTLIENYFSTHDRVADRVTLEVERAKQSVHFLAFSYTHGGISRAMLTRANAGVEVQGVFERTQAASGHSEYERMKAHGHPVDVYYDANPRNMHHKVIIIDGHTVITGSFNFSESADRTNDENIVIIRNNPKIATAFEQEFQKVYTQARTRDNR